MRADVMTVSYGRARSGEFLSGRCESRARARAQVSFSREGVSRVASYAAVWRWWLVLGWNNPTLFHTEARAREEVIKTHPLYHL